MTAALPRPVLAIVALSTGGRTDDARSGRWGFDDPDFLELCALVQQVRDPRSAPWVRLREVLRALPHAARLLAALRRLPSRRLHLSDSPAGRHVQVFFRRRLLDARHLVAISTLELPADPAQYGRGRSRQALRTNCARARRAGVRVGPLDDPGQVREHMADLFARRDDPDGGAWYFARADLREGEFWFATGADGVTLAVAEVIADERVALLRSMISAPASGRSEARYLLMSELLTAMAARGVRHVVVGRALSVPPGLVYFQRLLGFVPMNLRLSRGTGREG